MSLIETNYYAQWWGKQTAKGTANDAPGKRPIMVGGDMTAGRDDGEENYSDLSKYGARTEWVNSLTGVGEPVFQATPEFLAYAFWLKNGGEAVSAEAAVAGPPAIPAMSRHRFTPSTGMGHWFTVYQRVGSTVVRRQKFVDCVIGRLAIEASTANKAARATARILSLDPAITYASDPVAGLPTERPFLHTDLSQVGGAAAASVDGSLVVNGTTFRGVTAWSFVDDDAWEPIYGDDSRPYDFVQGTPGITVGATVYADEVGMAEWNRQFYGSASPAAGTRPLRSIPALGSALFTLRGRDAAGAHSGRELVVSVPGVKWTVPPAPGPSPDGGTAELSLAGTMRPVAGQQAYTLDVKTASTVAAFTV